MPEASKKVIEEYVTDDIRNDQPLVATLARVHVGTRTLEELLRKEAFYTSDILTDTGLKIRDWKKHVNLLLPPLLEPHRGGEKDAIMLAAYPLKRLNEASDFVRARQDSTEHTERVDGHFKALGVILDARIFLKIVLREIFEDRDRIIVSRRRPDANAAILPRLDSHINHALNAFARSESAKTVPMQSQTAMLSRNVVMDAVRLQTLGNTLASQKVDEVVCASRSVFARAIARNRDNWIHNQLKWQQQQMEHLKSSAFDFSTGAIPVDSSF